MVTPPDACLTVRARPGWSQDPGTPSESTEILQPPCFVSGFCIIMNPNPGIPGWAAVSQVAV